MLNIMKKGRCWVIDQKKLDKEKLSIFIKDLLKDKKRSN